SNLHRILSQREIDDRTDALAALHRGKSFIDFDQRQTRCQHVIEVQPALEIEARETRHVSPELVRTHIATGYTPFCDKVAERQIDPIIQPHETDHDCDATLSGHQKRLLNKFRRAYRLESGVHA